MTKFSIVTAEASQLEIGGKVYPCIILVGRGENKERLKRRVPVFPYFYLLEQDYKDLQAQGYFDKLHVEEVVPSCSRNIMKRAVTKVVVQDGGRIGDTIKMVNKYNKQDMDENTHTIFTYEADMGKSDMLPLRWMIDNNIKCGVEIEGNKYVPIDFSVPLRKWFIDFEAFTIREYSSGLNSDEPLIMVSIWDSYEEKLYTYYAVNEHWTYNQCLMVKKLFVPRTDINHEIKEFSNEAAFLDALMLLVQDKDPDMIIAWNLNRYDLPKWKQRCDANNKKCMPFRDISPLKSVLLHNKPIRVKGRVMFDLMVAFKQFTDAEMDSYSLAYVTESEELGVEKVPFTGTSGNTWDKYPEVMFKRNCNDVLIMKALDDKYGLVDVYDELRKEFGLLFHEGFVRNRVIDTGLLRMVNGEVVLSTVSYEKEPEEKLLGAVVVPPKTGSHYWACQLDVSRGYPKHIEGFNISPETFREKEPKEPHFTIDYEWYDEKTKVQRHFVAYFVKNPVGLLPRLIKFFNRKRTYYQEEMQKVIDAHGTESEIKKWERRQYNVKKTTNAIYGVMDYSKFRLHRKECTQATAIIGRIVIEELVRYLETLGYTMLYGDTDSTFIKLKGSNKEDCQREGVELCKKLNDHLDQFFKEKYGVTTHAELGFKAVYQKIKFLAKKNYAGKWVWDEKKGYKVGYEYKGISSVRSDNSNLEKTTVKNVLKLDLDDEDRKIIDTFIEGVLKDFKEHKYGPMDVAYPAQIKKRLWYDDKKKCWVTDYAILDVNKRIKFASHARAAIYTNMFLNTDFRQGDKPKKIISKITKGAVSESTDSI